jgi:hypothetical protein
MGEVWRARDTRLDRSVAVKVLPAELAANAQLRLRFEREARAISQLNHPHICTLYDVGDGYLVMELLEGETLADRIERGAIPVGETLRIGMQIADALDKAHRAGIVHRDLKPGNIMLTKSGAKLLDFGLAKPGLTLSVSPTSTEAAAPTMHRPLTQEGTILGTFQYMSPEQLEGIEADARSDIFALGCVLYEMITGRRAFEGKSRTSLIAAIVSSEPPPISQIQPLTPPAFEHVVRKCLEKDRDERWQSAYDVAEELRWISQAGSQAGVAAPITLRRKSRERVGWILLALAMLAAGMLAARALRLGQQRRTYRFSVPTFGDGYSASGSTSFTIAPDGQTLAFNAMDVDTRKTRIYVRRFDELTARVIPGSESMTVGRFTPDGQAVIATTQGKLVRLPLAGGDAQVIADVPGAARLAANGSVLYAGTDRRFYRLDPGASSGVPVTTLDKKRFEIYHTGAQLLPDDEHFLFISYRRPPDATGFLHDLYIGSLKGEPAVLVGDTPSRAEYANGRLYFVRDATLLSAPFDLKSKRFTGEPLAVASGVYNFKGTGQASFSVANDGTIVYRSGGFDQLQWFTIQGQRLATVAKAWLNAYFTLSRDESEVYVGEADPRDGIHHGWAYGLTRNTRSRMSYAWADEGAGLTTPDGQQVIFGSDRLDEPDIFIRSAAGNDEPRLLIHAPGIQVPNDVSPDGKYLLYMSNENPRLRYDIRALPLAGGPPLSIVSTPAAERDADFSPDGKWIAYNSDESGSFQIYVKPFPSGAARQVSINGGSLPHWSADGKSVLYIHGHTLMAAGVTNGVPSDPRALFEIPETIENFAVSRDGQRLLLLIAPDEEISPPLNVITGWQPPR